MAEVKRYTETLYPSYGQSFEMGEVLFHMNTEHQNLVIFENAQMGRVMALDGVIQTTQADEFIYHEMLTHVPLFAHGNAKRVLVIGGGDGGILREVFKHQSVEHTIIVEIDAKVIEMCKTYFPAHSNGAFDDPRLQIVINDGRQFVIDTEEKFDVVISDSTDPIGPGESLFTSAFYQGVARCLNPGGVFVAQNGVCFMQPDEVATTYQRTKAYFADRSFFTAAVPTYVGGVMTLAWGSQDASLRHNDVATISARVAASGVQTRYYTPAMHVAAFALPKYVEDVLTD